MKKPTKVFDPQKFDYRAFIEHNFLINDEVKLVPFLFRPPQNIYYNQRSNDDTILKARQEGFSSVIDAIFTVDFLLRPNSYSVIVADIDDNAQGLLERVKLYLDSWQSKNKIKIPLKYNNKNELFNQAIHSQFKIGTAENVDFGRSKTFTNLHLSEVAYYRNLKAILAGAGSAVMEGGRTILETTANGYNAFRTFWYDNNGFKKHFFAAKDFYNPEFLALKKLKLGELYPQEYPESPEEAFLLSGHPYFDVKAIKHLADIYQRVPIREAEIYAADI